MLIVAVSKMLFHKGERLTTPGGTKSSLSGSRTFPPPGSRPLLPPKIPGPTGSNLAPGGAPIGGRKPSPPQGPLSAKGPLAPRPKMGWSGPTNIPSPLLGGNMEGGANGFIGKGSKSLRPISNGFRGKADRGYGLESGASGGVSGRGRGFLWS
jgi:hypothetical protein